MRAVLRAIAACAGAWTTLVIASCIYTPRERLAPPGRVARAGDFTGVYCFASEAANVRRYSASDPAFLPFLHLGQLGEQSTVQVAQDATSVTFTIFAPGEPERTQRYDFTAHDGRIENGMLVVTPFQPSSPFGWYRTRRRSTMYRLHDGSLVLTDRHTATGLACALVPTYERSEVVVTLRAGGCGGAGAAAR